MTDITERKRAEDDLKRSNKELEQFAYVASHDLQEPLRVIARYTKILEQDLDDRLNEDSRENMGFIVNAAKRMQGLVDGVLSYSSVSSKGKKLELVSIDSVLGKVRQNLQVALNASRVRLRIPQQLPSVLGDQFQLIQVFQNLIGNAIKFRCKDRECEISISCKEAIDGFEFSVSDNGIGIDPEFFEQVFLMFQRLHTREEYPGTGIGLALVKKIVERHGGRVWVDSTPGMGTQFTFTLKRIDQFEKRTSK